MPPEAGNTETRRTIRRGEEIARDRLSIRDGESAPGLLLFAVLMVIAVLAAVTFVWVGEQNGQEEIAAIETEGATVHIAGEAPMRAEHTADWAR